MQDPPEVSFPLSLSRPCSRDAHSVCGLEWWGWWHGSSTPPPPQLTCHEQETDLCCCKLPRLGVCASLGSERGSGDPDTGLLVNNGLSPILGQRVTMGKPWGCRLKWTLWRPRDLSWCPLWGQYFHAWAASPPCLLFPHPIQVQLPRSTCPEEGRRSDRKPRGTTCHFFINLPQTSTSVNPYSFLSWALFTLCYHPYFSSGVDHHHFAFLVIL